MSRSARLLLFSLCAMVAVVALMSLGAARLAPAGALDDGTQVKRAANVVALSKDPMQLPPQRAGRALWLIGNSHTYALPGLKRGETLRNDPGVTLIDQLATELERRDPRRSAASFYRLADPNLLPTEMLVRAVWLLEQGHRPDVVVIGLTWRNVARDAALRHAVGRLCRDEAFVASLR
ncbi:MAG: hypothetical protein JNK82_29030, partial [Myxococcaceae bacterium]|nr:hypothetical protein [Myxococcaceae bacterium]